MRNFHFIFVSALLLWSCSGNHSSEEKRTVFRYNESAGITSLDPAFARDQAHIWVVNQLYNGLVQLDDKLEVSPCIARCWDISSDGLTYSFHLRDDVFFHDDPLFTDGKGRKVTASDFVYSFNRISSDELASPGAWIFNNVARKPDGRLMCEAPSDSLFVITLQRPFPPFTGLLSMQYCSVVPREVVEHYGKDFRMHPVGTGPFRFKMWKEGVKLVLSKNESYFEFENGIRLPYLDAVAITFIADKQSVFMEFIKGKLDFMSGIDASYKDELLTPAGKLNPKYSSTIKLITQPYLNTEYLGFMVDNKAGVNNGALLKKEVRQAINYGFDRVKMMKYLRNNIGTPGIYGFVPPGMPSFDSSLVRGYTYDPDRSRELLSRAGYPNGIGLPPVTLSTTASYLDLCQYIQQQLGELGIKVQIDVNPAATLREMIAKSKVNWFRGSWIADYPDAENYLSLFCTNNFCPKGPNYTHFSNPAYDALFERSQRETNDSLRAVLYCEMDRIIVEEAPVVILYYDQVLRFVRSNVAGLGSNAMNLLTLKKVTKK